MKMVMRRRRSETCVTLPFAKGRLEVRMGTAGRPGIEAPRGQPDSDPALSSPGAEPAHIPACGAALCGIVGGTGSTRAESFGDPQRRLDW